MQVFTDIPPLMVVCFSCKDVVVVCFLCSFNTRVSVTMKYPLLSLKEKSCLKNKILSVGERKRYKIQREVKVIADQSNYISQAKYETEKVRNWFYKVFRPLSIWEWRLKTGQWNVRLRLLRPFLLSNIEKTQNFIYSTSELWESEKDCNNQSTRMRDANLSIS